MGTSMGQVTHFIRQSYMSLRQRLYYKILHETIPPKFLRRDPRCNTYYISEDHPRLLDKGETPEGFLKRKSCEYLTAWRECVIQVTDTQFTNIQLYLLCVNSYFVWLSQTEAQMVFGSELFCTEKQQVPRYLGKPFELDKKLALYYLAVDIFDDKLCNLKQTIAGLVEDNMKLKGEDGFKQYKKELTDTFENRNQSIEYRSGPSQDIELTVTFDPSGDGLFYHQIQEQYEQ